MQPTSLNEHIALAKRGNENSISWLIEHYGRDVRAACSRFVLQTQNELSQSDLVQEAWIRIWSRLPAFNGAADVSQGDDQTDRMFRSWIRVTSRNVVTNLLERQGALRRKGSIESVEPEELADTYIMSASSILRTHEDNRAVQSALENLPEDERKIVEGCVLGGR